MAKRPNPNLAKIHRTYSVEDVANLFSVHKNTVRSWIKDGLATNDDKRPMLILGSDLKQYMQSKRKSNKRKCLPFEIYCLRCRIPQLPAENMVDYEPINDRMAMQPGYKSRISYNDTEYFNLSEKEVRIATARRETAVPTLEQIIHVIGTMPNNSDIEKRNRSLIAFTLLTGARDSAIASMKLKHI